jgi:hypothetical protein
MDAQPPWGAVSDPVDRHLPDEGDEAAGVELLVGQADRPRLVFDHDRVPDVAVAHRVEMRLQRPARHVPAAAF